MTLRLEYAACVADAFCCAILVSCDDPGADASLMEVGYAFFDILLQQVFDTARSQQV